MYVLYSVFTIGVLRSSLNPAAFWRGIKECYNYYMPRHFSHLTPEQQRAFNRDMKVLTGMLYSVVKAPWKPFLPAFYKTAREYKKDYETLYNPPNKE